MPDYPADPGEGLEAQVTTEFHTVSAAQLPARIADLRDELPGLEAERRITDWGRSERVEGIVDRLLVHPLYHYWLRAEVEGIDHLPLDGGALLVANHAGVLPLDALMVAKAVRAEHPLGRPLHLSADPRLAALPGLGMALTKLGGVAAHPANLHRLLYDEREFVLAFPEGRAGAGKPLGRRYLLRRFETDLIAVAARAGVPIVPVAVLGAEEAAPVLGRLRGRRLGRFTGLPLALPLPAKFRLRFLEPVSVGTDERDAGSLVALAADLRALIQENLLELVGARRSVWLG